MFCAGPNFLSQPKNSTAFSASPKGFEDALKAVKFLGWLKKFGPAQNILGPVKGQGIRIFACAQVDGELKKAKDQLSFFRLVNIAV